MTSEKMYINSNNVLDPEKMYLKMYVLRECTASVMPVFHVGPSGCILLTIRIRIWRDMIENSIESFLVLL